MINNPDNQAGQVNLKCYLNGYKMLVLGTISRKCKRVHSRADLHNQEFSTKTENITTNFQSGEI